MSEAYTIDELAQRAQTRASTVRLYQTRGLLPPPEIRGRIGYYSAAHLARLRAIDRLQQRGFSLAAIKELLDNWEQGVSLATILDPQNELAAFGQPGELTVAEFATLFPGDEVDPAVVQRAMSLGLMEFDPERGTVRVPSMAFVEIGRELAAYQVPAARSVTEFEELATDARRIAHRFTALFEEYVAGPHRANAGDTTALSALTERFNALAATAVQELVSHALNRARTDPPSEQDQTETDIRP